MIECTGWHQCDQPRIADDLSQAREVIPAAVQKKAFPKEFETLIMNNPVPINSRLCHLSPILQNNLMCVGGRLRNANIHTREKTPVILPKDDQISLLVVRHHHAQVKHQGCHLKEGAVRQQDCRSWEGKEVPEPTRVLIQPSAHLSYGRFLGTARRVARRILDSLLHEQFTHLNHDVLCTLMVGDIAIINARPQASVSNDHKDAFILSPANLLTQKAGVPPPPGDFTDKDLLTKQWRQV